MQRSVNCGWITVHNEQSFLANLRIALDTEVEAGGPYLNDGWNKEEVGEIMPKLGDEELIRVFAKHDPYESTGHLGEVMHEMMILGAPKIKVVEYRGDYYALEGSHRLACAHYFGLVPILEVVQPDSTDPADESFWDKLKDELTSYTWVTTIKNG